MSLSNKIKRKYYFKCFTMIWLCLIYFPIIGIVISQSVFTDYYLLCLCVSILQIVIGVILVNIYEKRFILPSIYNLDDLENYIEYFATAEISDLEYVEAITWFSKYVRDAYLEKRESNDDFSKTINELYLILRPQNTTGRCIALNHKNIFIRYAKELHASLDLTNISNILMEMQNESPQKYNYIKALSDKNNLVYFAFFPVHFLACVLISKNVDSSFSMSTFVGNLLIYIPADILAILLYKGIIKDRQKEIVVSKEP